LSLDVHIATARLESLFRRPTLNTTALFTAAGESDVAIVQLLLRTVADENAFHDALVVVAALDTPFGPFAGAVFAPTRLKSA
jgi:hypothetical protein